jgi:hypothetical protein
MLMAQAKSMLRGFIEQAPTGEKRQAKERLQVTLGRMLMWVGGASLLVSCALFVYIVGALLARFVAWSF